jgi:hypothetical protein
MVENTIFLTEGLYFWLYSLLFGELPVQNVHNAAMDVVELTTEIIVSQLVAFHVELPYQ